MNMLSRRPVQIVVGIIVALALFGGGYAFGSSKAPATTVATTTGATGATARGGQGAQGGGAGARGITTGQIIAVNSDSITLQVRTGGQNGASPTITTQLVLVGTGTRVVKTAETDIKLSDLKVGDQVSVAGTPDTASGTVSAQAIVLGGTNILGDILGGTQFPGRGGASGSPRPSPTR
ncbi:MAG: hypothetical protein ABI888_04970 [Chloroflexota bacterium]